MEYKLRYNAPTSPRKMNKAPSLESRNYGYGMHHHDRKNYGYGHGHDKYGMHSKNYGYGYGHRDGMHSKNYGYGHGDGGKMHSKNYGYGYGYGHGGKMHSKNYGRGKMYSRNYGDARKGGNDHNAHIRFGHAVANGPDVVIYIDNQPLAQNIYYGYFQADYFGISPGQHNIKVIPDAANASPIVDVNLTLKEKTSTTVLVVGDIKSLDNQNLPKIQAITFKDDLTCPSRGQSHLRFIHAAAGVPAVDIYANGSIAFQDVAYMKKDGYAPIPAGTYEIGVTLAGQDELVLESTIGFNPKTINTIYAIGIPGDKQSPLKAILTEDSGGACIVTRF